MAVTHGGATFDVALNSHDLHLVCGSEGIGTYASVQHNADWLLEQVDKFDLQVEWSS